MSTTVKFSYAFSIMIHDAPTEEQCWQVPVDYFAALRVTCDLLAKTLDAGVVRLHLRRIDMPSGRAFHGGVIVVSFANSHKPLCKYVKNYFDWMMARYAVKTGVIKVASTNVRSAEQYIEENFDSFFASITSALSHSHSSRHPAPSVPATSSSSSAPPAAAPVHQPVTPPAATPVHQSVTPFPFHMAPGVYVHVAQPHYYSQHG